MAQIKKLSDITLQDIADDKVIYDGKKQVKEYLGCVEGNVHLLVRLDGITETNEHVWIPTDKLSHYLTLK